MALPSLKPRFDFTSPTPGPLGVCDGYDWWLACEFERIRSQQPLKYFALRLAVRTGLVSPEAAVRH
jgi:hypothetical protein